MTWTSVGAVGTGTNVSSFSLTPGGVGDLMMLEIVNWSNATVIVNSVASTNVTWTAVGNIKGTANAQTATLFMGTVTAASAATVTLTWSGTAPSGINISWKEFKSSVGSWSVDKVGTVNSAGTNTWASLTPTASGELYYGFCNDNGSAGGGSTAGYTYFADTNGCGTAYNLNCAGGTATAPVWTDAGHSTGVMALMAEGAAAPVGILPQQAKHRAPAVFTRLTTAERQATYSR